MSKFISLLLALFFLNFQVRSQSAIDPSFNSCNGWMTDNIGDVNPPLNSLGPSIDPVGLTTNPSGILYGIGNNTTLVDNLHMKLLRFGGITNDINFYTQTQAQDFINFCTSRSLTPVFQIPFLYFYHGQSSVTNALSTTNITTIKNMVTFLKSNGVNYYSISNESDRYHVSPFNENGGNALTATQIAEFFKAIAVAIKEVDVDAFIFGPDLASAHENDLMLDLIGGTGNITGRINQDPLSLSFDEQGGPAVYFCDAWSFHRYRFDGTQNRQNVINDPANPTDGFQIIFDKIRNRIISSSSNPNLKISVTELNVNWKNPPTNDIAGFGCNSFLAGQWLAETYSIAMDTKIKSGANMNADGAPVIAMMPWSWHQSFGDATDYDLGILHDDVDNSSGTPDYTQIYGRSTYWHLYWLQTFNGNFYPATVSGGSNVKAFAAHNSANNIVVMVINQDQTTDYDFAINLSGTASTGTVKINFSISSASGSNEYIGNGTPNDKVENQSTVLFVFTSTGDFISRCDYKITGVIANPSGYMPCNPAIGIAPTAVINKTNSTCPYDNGSVAVNPSCLGGCNIVTISDGVSSYSLSPFASTLGGLSPGTYTVSIVDNYGTGNSYVFQMNPSFFQYKAIYGPITIINNTEFAGEVHIKSGGTLNISNAIAEFAPNSKIVIESGGILDISNSTLQTMTSCPGDWEIEIQPGGSLNLNSGAVLNLNGTGRIFADAGYDQAGNPISSTIVFNQGASINLIDPSTVLEIKGNLQVGPAAVFTYSGNGYVKFSSPFSPSSNITAFHGASMVFQKNNSNQKALEITQESLYPPSQLSLFKIDKCKVELGSGARINPAGLSTQIIVTNSKIIGTGNNFARGLTLFGQPNVTINNNTFQNCHSGIYALLTFGGAPLTVSNCTFENCGYGIESHDKGVKLINNKFYNCQTAGWYSTAASFPSQAQNCVFGTVAKPNFTGIDYFGGANGSLFLNKCKVNYNSSGIFHAGTTLKILCSEVMNNSDNGIYLFQNGTLNMSNDLGGGNTNLGGNGTNNNDIGITLDNARTLYLNNGFNNLATHTSQHLCVTQNHLCHPSIVGTLSTGYDPCNTTDCSDIILPSNQNDWRDPNNTNPVSGIHYDIQTSYACQFSAPRTIQLTDNSPHALVNCNVINNKPPVEHILANCPTCHNINTPDFVNTKLNDAVKTAKDKMELPANGNNNKEAVKLFHQILKYPINSPSVQERKLLDIAYLNMQEALGNAFQNGEVTEAMNSPVLGQDVQRVIDVQDDILSRIPCDKNYHERLATNMEKAEALRLAGRRDMAIQVFDYILSWVAPVDQPYVQRWRCITDAEQMLKDGSLVPDNFRSTVAACGTSSGSKLAAPPVSRFQENPAVSTFSIVPNPNNGKFSFRFENENLIDSKVVISDVLGKQIKTYDVRAGTIILEADLSEFQNGIYFATLIGNGQITESKKIVVNR